MHPRQVLMLEILQMLPILWMLPILSIRSYCNVGSFLAGLVIEQVRKNNGPTEELVAAAVPFGNNIAYRKLELRNENETL